MSYTGLNGYLETDDVVERIVLDFALAKRKVIKLAGISHFAGNPSKEANGEASGKKCCKKRRSN